MGFDFTPAQARAITERGGAVLVSAAAGSGKTRVLTERLIRRVTDPENPVDIDRFLVITYTRAAAAELRGRIMEALAAQAAAHPEDRRLRRQQSLCCRAHIGTIHSFCADIIRENCHLLGIPPTFTVADEERAERIRALVLSRLLDERYETIEDDPAFRLLADTVGAGRDDRKLEAAVLRLFDNLRALPRPEDWLAAQKTALRCEGVADVGETLWGRELLAAAKEEAAYQSAAMEGALAEIQSAGGAIAKAYGPSFTATAEGLRDLARALDQGWDRAREFCAVPFPRLGGLRNFEDEALKGRVTEAREACRKAAKKLQEQFARDSAALLESMRAAAPAMEALLDLTAALDRAFTAEKLRRGCLDFSDLERFAARLLTDAEGSPTPVAIETSRRFEEVMVDEYQDVSPIQDRIFTAVSREGKNLFLVGDVKQSIYRFRLADPGLFLEKYARFSAAEQPEEGQPRKILLRENFRSRAAVLDAANAVFSAIMSRELGELDYDEDAALRFGAKGYPEGTDAPAELCVVDAGAGGEQEENALPPEKNELEARYVAGRILEMMEAGTPVYTPDGPRRCGWDDFVILLRTPGERGGVFRRVLAEYGIPTSGSSAGSFFTSLEVTVAVNLLSLVDNPHADVPLISVLRSPAFGFSGDDLSAIRAGRREGDFYGAVRSAAENGDGRCAAFLEKLDGWRALAPDLTPEALLWRVCGDTDLFAVCAAMRDGEARQARLTLLFEYARSFSAGGETGLFRFLSWLRRLSERGQEPEIPGGGSGAVRILSIHKSKGLEFPFVFLCDLNHFFNKTDTMAGVLFHTELGLGPKRVDTARGVEYPTLARRAIVRRMTTELLSEEMRVLYVAMTRARERLVMTATLTDAENKLEKLRDAAARPPFPPALLRSAPSPLRWLTLAALAAEDRIRLRIIGQLAEASAPEAVEETNAEAAEALDRVLRENLAFSYPYAGAEALPSRLTATGLAGRDGDAEAVSLAEEPPAFLFRSVDFGDERPLTPTERGIATHSFLQYLDFTRTGSRAELSAELDRIASAGYLRPREKDGVDLGTVEKLFASPLGKAMRASDTLRREFRFTLLAEARDYYPEAGPEDRLLLQGVVDCFFVEDGGITVVDYKTDRVTAETAPERAEHYRNQLRAYAGALERILGLPVKRCALWFLRPAALVEIPMK